MRTITISNADARAISDVAMVWGQSGLVGSAMTAAATLQMYQAAITGAGMIVLSELEKLSVVDAVFCEREADGVLHIYTVVREHTDDVYMQLIDAEDRIRAAAPVVDFSFRVRAHQGRDPRSAVPVNSEPVFVR